MSTFRPRELSTYSRRICKPALQPHVLITGGAGFIGTNLAHRLLSRGARVLIYDNLSRPGVERNLNWLCSRHGDALRVTIADLDDPASLSQAVREASWVFHFAAQVAVTSSLMEPLHDFQVNAWGTVQLLETLRRHNPAAPLIFTSTNKVYGELLEVRLNSSDKQYTPEDDRLKSTGIGESQRLDFHSPYGCSKGAADQYVIDFAQSFKLPATVFRMSCIYGPHQLGTEDQGWVAHFMLRSLEGLPITIYGDGLQVRDLLYVDDLVEAFLLALEKIDKLAGGAYNIGGGPRNAVSLIQLLDMIEAVVGSRPALLFEDWRRGDQRYYVSDHRAFTQATGWVPKVAVQKGLERLYRWMNDRERLADSTAVTRTGVSASAGQPT